MPCRSRLDVGSVVFEGFGSIHNRARTRNERARVHGRTRAGEQAMIGFKKDLLHDFDAAITREWLETNGIGGFACSTVIGINTRRYHALLTAALPPPAGRVVLLSK